MSGNESQKHGLLFEEAVIKELQLQSTDYTHEFDAKDSQGRCYSIKFIACFASIPMGSALIQFNKNHCYELIVGRYRQDKDVKTITEAYQYHMSIEAHQSLFPTNLTPQIKNIEDKIKCVPSGYVRPQVRSNILWECQMIKMPFGVCLNPKMDSKNQRRLQCSLQNIPNHINKISLDSLVGTSFNSKSRVRKLKSTADLSKEFF